MKKHFYYIALVFILLTVMVFGACAKPAPAPPTPLPAPTPAPTPPPTREPEPTPPPPTPEVVKLIYDDLRAEAFLAARGYGYIVEFLPPEMPFTIKGVGIIGVIYGTGWEGKSFTVAIWDKDYEVLYSADYPVTKFVVDKPTLVKLETPDVEVADKFYVHVYTGTGKLEGIHIGADDSVVNLHSGLTFRTEEGVTKISTGWPYPESKWFGDISKVNWMIRVGGITTAQPTPSPTPTPMPSTTVQINTASGTERELKTKAALERLLAEYDVSKWMFTKSVLIEKGALPHAYPVLTLSTRYLPYDYMHLSTFIHEQIHWFLSEREGKVNQAINELRILYPKVPVDSRGLKSARTELSTYSHLIVNYLEFSAIVELVGEESAVSTIERMGHYTWIYETVLSDRDKIEEIVRKYGLIIE